MSDTIRSTVQQLRNLVNPSDVGRKELLNMTIALGVANVAVLPSSSVTSPTNWYNTNNLDLVHEFVSELNELLVIDTKLVMKQIFRAWQHRYNVLHYAARTSFVTPMIAILNDGTANEYRIDPTNSDQMAALGHGVYVVMSYLTGKSNG